MGLYYWNWISTVELALSLDTQEMVHSFPVCVVVEHSLLLSASQLQGALSNVQ